MLVKLDSIAPSYWCYWWSFERGDDVQTRKFCGKKEEAPNDLRLFRLLPFIIVFQTDLFVVLVWEKKEKG